MPSDTRFFTRKRLLLGALVLLVIFACALSMTIRPDSSSASYDPESAAQLIAGGPSAHVEAQGLVMTLQINPGPYFLGELVADEMTLTNNSAVTYTLHGYPGVAGCEAALWPDTSGGGPPTYTLPTSGIVKCPGGTSPLSPGQTWMTDCLFPLTDSGDVTLQAQARFSSIVSGDGEEAPVAAVGPFAQQWPQLNLTVAPNAPSGSAISLHHSHWLLTKQVTIDAPATAQSHLYYIFVATCGSGPGSVQHSSLAWQPVLSDTLDDPGCDGGNETWTYSVGAPGYEIASGRTRSVDGERWTPRANPHIVVWLPRGRLQNNHKDCERSYECCTWAKTLLSSGTRWKLESGQ